MVSSYVKRLYQRFLRIRGTPREIGLGFALGLIIGFSPTMGVQIVFAVFMASVLKWSKIAAAAAVQITNPITAPFIYSATYYLGAKIMGIEKPLKPAALMYLDGLIETTRQAPQIFAALTIGGILIGLPLAAVGYLVVYRFFERYQSPLKSSIVNRTSRLREKMKMRKSGLKK